MSVTCCHHLPYGQSRGCILCSIDLKFGQNVCLDEISDEFQFKLSGIKNQKYLVGTLEATFFFCSTDLKIGQNVCLNETPMSLGHLGVKTRSVGQINPFPHMPILDSSNSATNKDIMS